MIQTNGFFSRLGLKPLHNESGELLHLDLLRFIAAYAIVFYHFARFSTGNLNVLMRHFHTFELAVDLFFVISGFIISYVYDGKLKTRNSYFVFLKRRFARLAPLHWLTLFIFVAIGLLVLTGKMKTDHPQDYDWGCLAPNFFALHALGICNGLSFNFVSWSISAEWFMYIIAPAVLALSSRNTIITLGLSIGIILILFVISGGFGSGSPYPWYKWTTHFGVLRALPEFMLGATFFQLRGLIARLPAPRLWLGTSLLFFFAGSIFEVPMSILLIFMYTTAIAAIACDQINKPIDWLTKFGVLGQLTYSIYMVHPIILTLFLTFIGSKLIHLHGLAENIWLLLVSVMVLAVGYLSFVFFETPARRWINALKF